MNNYKIVKNKDIKWGRRELSEICLAIKDGTHGSFENNFGEKSRYLLSSKNVKSGKLVTGKSERMISENDYYSIIKNGFPKKGDLLLTTVGTIGEKMLWENEFSEAFQRSVSFIRVKENISNKFLYYCFSTNYLKDEIKNKTKVGAQPGIYLGDLKSLSVFIPPLYQQTSIANILSVQESIINDMETLVEKYETRLRYLSEELLSGRFRVKEVDGKTVFYKNTEWKDVEVNGDMKEIPADWEVEKLDKNITCNMGETILSANIEKLRFPGSIPVVSASQDDKYFGYMDSKLVSKVIKKGSMTICARGSIGFPRIAKEDVASTQTTIQIRSDKLDLNYLGYFLNINHNVFFNATGGAVPQLTLEMVNNFEIIKPKNILEVGLILNTIVVFKRNIEEYNQLLEKEKKKLTFLLNNLLSGNYLVEENIESNQ